jgi:hypothetical protein
MSLVDDYESKYALNDKARKQVAAMLSLVSDAGPVECKRCRRFIWWLKLPNGKKMPYTDDAVSHFADCPHAEEFRKR